jgi:glucokinase
MVLGLDIGGTHMRLVLADRRGKLHHRHKGRTGSREGVDRTVQRLVAMCRRGVAAAAAEGSRVVAVGAGVAGKIDRRRGEVLFSPNLPEMNGYPLGAELERQLGLAVFLENDANAFGLGEHWQGSARGIANWVGITLGTGVGGCLMLNHDLWRGDDLGFAGEVGHMIIDPAGPVCACGAHGCLEAHASGSALLQGVERAVASGRLTSGPLWDLRQRGALTPRSVHACALGGNALARELFERMGWALGLALANLFSILGIRHGLLGGGVSGAWDLFIAPLMASLVIRCRMLPAGDASIRRSALGDDAALLGSARLAWQGHDARRGHEGERVSRLWPPWAG